MRKAVIIGLAFMLTIPVFGRTTHSNKRLVKTPAKRIMDVNEPVFINSGNSTTLHGPITRHSNNNSSRESSFFSTLIDSSLNGYGPYNNTPNPLAYGLDEGYIAVYRQYQGEYTEGVSAGYIGASQSEDGEEWDTEQKLNTRYPTGQEEPDLPTSSGTPQGRYPSAGFTVGGKPTAIWNEYTNTSQGGGENGGYPLYAYDSDGMGEFSTWVNPFNLNNGCSTTPCDPPDLWVGNTYINGANGSPLLTSIFGEGLGPTYHYFISSNFHANGYFIMNDPYVISDNAQVVDNGDPLWYQNGDYTGSPDYHINEDGVGYMGQVSFSYGSDTEEPMLHTLFFKKTEDYGASWTSDEGYLNTGYHYISDEVLVNLSDSLNTLFSENPEEYPNQLWYPDAMCDTVDAVTGDTSQYTCGDTIFYSNVDGPIFLTPGWFFYYDYDIQTDNDGGLHFITVAVPMVCPDSSGGCEDSNNDGLVDTLYTEGRFGSAGHIYFYNPDPIDQPNNWTATLLNDLSDTYYADWDLSDIPIVSDPQFYFFPEITRSAEEDSEVMWYAGFKGSSFSWSADMLNYLPGDIDIYMRKSTDNGRTWTELENVTQSESGIFPDKSIEVAVHLATTATDNEVGLFFQMPDFYHETLPPAASYEDYLNRVYVGIYSNDAEGGTVGIDQNLLPNAFTLMQNYPNPFNPVTHIRFDVAVAGNVMMDLFDIRGAKVKTLLNEVKPAGMHEFTFDGSHLSSGIYFYSMTANNVTQTRKLVLMK